MFLDVARMSNLILTLSGITSRTVPSPKSWWLTLSPVLYMVTPFLINYAFNIVSFCLFVKCKNKQNDNKQNDNNNIVYLITFCYTGSMNDFFTRVDEVLRRKDITQKALAEYLGLSSCQIYANWKKRNSIPSADIAVKIAQFLNVSVEWLVIGKEQQRDKQIKTIMKAVKKEIEKTLASAEYALNIIEQETE